MTAAYSRSLDLKWYSSVGCVSPARSAMSCSRAEYPCNANSPRAASKMPPWTPSTDTLVETAGTVPLCLTTSSSRSNCRQDGPAHRGLWIPRKSRARPDPAGAAGHAGHAAAARRRAAAPRERDPQQRPVRGPRRQPREDDQRRPRPRRPGRRQRHRHRHPLRRVRVLRAVARRGAGAQREGPGAPAAVRARRRQRPVLHPRVHGLRRGHAHRARAREAVGAPRRPSPGWTSTPN